MHAYVILVIVLLECTVVQLCFGRHSGGGGGGGYSTSFKKVGPPVIGSIGGHVGQGWSGGYSGSHGSSSGRQGGYGGGYGGSYGGGWPTGPKASYGDWKGGEVWRPYHFGYQTHAHDAITSREEKTDERGRVSGYYTLMTADGRNRKVSYVADEHGFRAKVDTNEPGTASEGPASIHFHSSDPKIAHAPIRHKGGYGDWRSKERDHGGLAGEYPGHYGGWQVSTNVNHGGWNTGENYRNHGAW